MRKSFITLALAALVLPVAVSAQSVNVTVQVAATASGTAVGTLDLGSLAPGASATVSPGAATGVGAVQITHTGNFSIGAASNSATLTRSGGTETVSVTLSCQYRDAATSGTALAPTAAAAVNCNSVPNWSAGGSTAVYLQVGGSITVPGAQTSGTYNGTVSFTVTAL